MCTHDGFQREGRFLRHWVVEVQDFGLAIRHFLQRAVFAVENPEVPFVGIREDV